MASNREAPRTGALPGTVVCVRPGGDLVTCRAWDWNLQSWKVIYSNGDEELVEPKRLVKARTFVLLNLTDPEYPSFQNNTDEILWVRWRAANSTFVADWRKYQAWQHRPWTAFDKGKFGFGTVVPALAWLFVGFSFPLYAEIAIQGFKEVELWCWPSCTETPYLDYTHREAWDNDNRDVSEMESEGEPELPAERRDPEALCKRKTPAEPEASAELEARGKPMPFTEPQARGEPRSPAEPQPSAVSCASFSTSAFREAYNEARCPRFPHELLAAVHDLLVADGRADAETFFAELEAEVFTDAEGLRRDVRGAATRLWTSGCRNHDDEEFCQILNRATRSGFAVAGPAAVVARAINANLLMDRVHGPSGPPPYPVGGKCYRGGGLPDEHKAFFFPGMKYRVPNYLATSYEDGRIVSSFMRRSPHPAVKWEIQLDVRGDPGGMDDARFLCKHVNFIARRAPDVPDEKEFLFVPYSVFEVISTAWSSNPTPTSPHVVTLRAAVDNREELEDLPLAPWS